VSFASGTLPEHKRRFKLAHETITQYLYKLTQNEKETMHKWLGKTKHANLVAYYDFSEGKGSVLHDFSGVFDFHIKEKKMTTFY